MCSLVGFFVCACTEISLMLEAGPSLVSIVVPDACEDNLMEEHYTLYGSVSSIAR
jgi:hypothetical protein